MAKEPTVTNAADPRQVRRNRKAEHRAELQRRLDLREVLRTRSGRRYLWTLLCECGVFTSSFDPEALMMARNEGERNVGLRLFAEINEVDPAMYHTMAIEAQQDAEAESAEATTTKEPEHDDTSSE